MRGARNKNWCFTINNYQNPDVVHVKDLEKNDDVCRLVAEYERGSQNQTPHIQGYVSFFVEKYIEQVEELLGGRAHIERARGGWRQNYTYCTKEKNVFAEKNCNITTPEPSPCRITKEALEDMKKLDPFAFEDKYPGIMFRYRKQVYDTMRDNALRNLEEAWPGSLPEKNIWIWGKTGLGKSKWATGLFPLKNQYKKMTNKWWGGYDLLLHKIVIIEDYPCLPAGDFLCQHMKLWADRYVFQGEIKGSEIMINPGRFFLIVTSNFSIQECFSGEENIEALLRRFNEIHITSDNKNLICATHVNPAILTS